MAKRKKRIFQSHSSTKRSFWLRLRWLLVGLFFGLLISIGLSLYTGSTWQHWIRPGFFNPSLKPKTEPKRSVNSSRKEPKGTSAELNQRFEFYNLLPGMEVQIPDRPETQDDPSIPFDSKTKLNTILPKKTPPKPIERKLAATGYIIQAGSYRHRITAEKLKTYLHQQGFKAVLQAIDAEDGTWFRVTLGPFTDESKALQQKKRLQQYQIHGILILQRS